MGIFGEWADTKLTTLKDGTRVCVREVLPGDIDKIAEYIDHLSDSDRALRYMCGISKEALKRPERLDHIYRKSLECKDCHVAFVVTTTVGDILGVSHAWKAQGGSYELSYSRRSDMANKGIGRLLMNAVLEWAGNDRKLVADTLHHNLPMKMLFEKNGFRKVKNEEDPSVVRYEYP